MAAMTEPHKLHKCALCEGLCAQVAHHPIGVCVVRAFVSRPYPKQPRHCEDHEPGPYDDDLRPGTQQWPFLLQQATA